MRSRGEQGALESTAEIKTRAEQVLGKLKVNDMRILGVVGEGPLASYVALLKNFSTERAYDTRYGRLRTHES